MSYQIVTDSSCNLPEDLIEELNLEVLPLTFMVDEVQYQSFLKGEKTDLKQFYTMMREGKVITTSLPNLASSEELFRRILDNGTDVLYLGFSSGLSGTYEGMSGILDRLAPEYPNLNIMHIDTLAASLGQGLLVYLAAKMQESGASMDEVAQWVRDNRMKQCSWFTVDDLMFLFRGGRLSRTAAFAGSLLKIKPILHIDEAGHLVAMEKAKGRKKSIHALADHFEKHATKPWNEQVVTISHGDCAEDLDALKTMMEERFGVTKFITNYVDPVIGAHSGPGTLALFFMGDER